MGSKAPAEAVVEMPASAAAMIGRAFKISSSILSSGYSFLARYSFRFSSGSVVLDIFVRSAIPSTFSGRISQTMNAPSASSSFASTAVFNALWFS